MKRVVCFGEIMMRLNPEGYLRFKQARKFEVSYAGAEANVAVSLANFGMDASFVTKLPDNDLAANAINSLRAVGVDTTDSVIGGDRIGVFFLEKGASQRPSKVIYDRKYSSISMAAESDFNWDKIFDNCEWFHFTGISPALSDNVARICFDACKSAKAKGIKIICDLNYRSSLWSSEKAQEIMKELMKYVDVCIANVEHARIVLGINTEVTDFIDDKLTQEGLKRITSKIAEEFGCKKVAFTFRESLSASENKWSGILHDNGQLNFSKSYHVNIVDRVGSGDSFTAGLIYSFMNQYSTKDALEFAVAASCLKHSIEFDYNYTTVDEVKDLMYGDGSGRIQR